MDVFERAVTAFRRSVSRSQSSNSIRNYDEYDSDNRSVISSSSSTSIPSNFTRRSQTLVTAANHISLLRRPKCRSRSANRQGDTNSYL